jgi:tRNA (guanine-N7-)-methyltransferase
VTAADVGCGFGGLLVRLAPHLPPGELALGIELRDKVCNYVRGRAAALRAAGAGGGGGGGSGGGGGGEGGGAGGEGGAPSTSAPASSTNKGEAIAALRVNAQRHLPALFPTRSLRRLFFLFPDPHFKARTARRRIVTAPLVGEYAALVAPGGILYTATDVEELGGWMRRTVRRERERRERREREKSAPSPARLHLRARARATAPLRPPANH